MFCRIDDTGCFSVFMEAICGQPSGMGSHALYHKCIVLEFCHVFNLVNLAMQQVPGLLRLRIKKSANKVQIYEKIPEMS